MYQHHITSVFMAANNNQHNALITAGLTSGHTLTKIQYIIIYLCTETQHYCLLTGGAVKIKSGPLWF